MQKLNVPPGRLVILDAVKNPYFFLEKFPDNQIELLDRFLRWAPLLWSIQEKQQKPLLEFLADHTCMVSTV
jgi:hypothetical protein